MEISEAAGGTHVSSFCRILFRCSGGIKTQSLHIPRKEARRGARCLIGGGIVITIIALFLLNIQTRKDEALQYPLQSGLIFI